MRLVPFDSVAVLVSPGRDNVAVVHRPLAAGTQLEGQGGRLWQLQEAVQTGQRFALVDIPSGDALIQYGQAFALSKGIREGQIVTLERIVGLPARDELGDVRPAPQPLAPWEGSIPVFDGFRRPDGRVGVRNWLLVVPMSLCAAHATARIAREAEMGDVCRPNRFSNVSGVTHLYHAYGCGCPDMGSSARQPGVLDTLLRMLGWTIDHPNVGGAILVALGCEKTHFEMASSFWAEMFSASDGSLSDIFGKPIQTITIQDAGGSAGAVEAGLAAAAGMLGILNRCERQAVPASDLILGLECGGSDAFSGITANPALGAASDLIVRAGGCSVISEVPEFHGAETGFLHRAVDQAAAAEIRKVFEGYARWIAAQGARLEENPSPGNQAGGLLNIAIKSLGAVAKSGRAPVMGALQYGESLANRKRKGLYLLNTPGYDPISVPGLVAAGAQVVCFTTGRGTPLGNAIAPVIKIASHDELAQRMAGDMDFNAGVVLGGRPLDLVGRALFNRILSVASGQITASERNGHREFAIWDREGITL
jgi:altronate hydrolase